MRILVVDDDPLARKMVARMLPRFTVEVAVHAAEAFAILERGSYDLVLVDVCLGCYPDTSGTALVERLRAGGFTAAIILMSGLVGIDELQAETLRVGADAALAKGDIPGPFMAALVQTVVAARTGRRDPVDAEGHLSADLQALIDNVLDSDADLHAAKAQYVYHLAILARAVYAHANVHRTGFDACCRAVGLSQKTLQPFVSVARRFDACELRRLFLELGLSMSHVKLLARLPLAACPKWTDRVAMQRLTVEQLRLALRDDAC